ncbi:hypothetical protein C8R44DRAFT_880465 [Mycena epipterygia]|nr:hypothetical protein C8R44DRAFT_880465 [Mycena epipterygia]
MNQARSQPSDATPGKGFLGAPNNPILLDENGRVVTSFGRPPRAARPTSPSSWLLSIFRGPPSSIIPGGYGSVPPLFPAGGGPPTSGQLASRAGRPSRPPLRPVVQPAPSHSITPLCIRRRVPGAGEGKHAERDDELTEKSSMSPMPDPQLTAVLKPMTVAYASISSPIQYECGHGHCYVCIRTWLKRSWQCPQCWQRMTAAPTRSYATEASITIDHPLWSDPSVVTYSWAGLKFPKPLIVPVTPSL